MFDDRGITGIVVGSGKNERNRYDVCVYSFGKSCINNEVKLIRVGDSEKYCECDCYKRITDVIYFKGHRFPL